MGALNISNSKSSGEEDLYATQLLAQLASIYHSMNASERMRVCKRVQFSGALPISRDTESYTAMMSVLDGMFCFLYRVFFSLYSVISLV